MLELKKSPHLSYGQSTGQKVQPGSHRVTVLMEQGFERFLDLCEKVFSFTAMSRGGLPLQVKFFMHLSQSF